MKPNMKFSKLAPEQSIEKAVKSLADNGIVAKVTENEEEAKKEVLKLVSPGDEVFTMSSVTLDKTEIAKEIDESGKYNSVRNKLNSLDRNTQKREMKKEGAAPQISIGSVHAVTEDGKIFIASGSGSQISAAVYGADKVIFVIGTQKIVKDTDEAMKRIYEYSYPLENQRMMKAHGVGSYPRKILIINKESTPERIFVIFIKENIGF